MMPQTATTAMTPTTADATPYLAPPPAASASSNTTTTAPSVAQHRVVAISHMTLAASMTATAATWHTTPTATSTIAAATATSRTISAVTLTTRATTATLCMIQAVTTSSTTRAATTTFIATNSCKSRALSSMPHHRLQPTCRHVR